MRLPRLKATDTPLSPTSLLHTQDDQSAGKSRLSPQAEHLPCEILMAKQARLTEVDTMAAMKGLVWGGPFWASNHLCRRTNGPGHQGCGLQSWAGMIPWKLLEFLFPPAPSQAESIQWYFYSTSSGVCLPGVALGPGDTAGNWSDQNPSRGYSLSWEMSK